MQTSLATRPKHRASTYEHGLTNLSTPQSTYANHQVIIMPYANGELQSGAQAHCYLPPSLSHLVWPVGAHIYSPKQRYGRWGQHHPFCGLSDHTLMDRRTICIRVRCFLQVTVETSRFSGSVGPSVRPNGERRTISIGPYGDTV